jgi:hypothetical protein
MIVVDPPDALIDQPIAIALSGFMRRRSGSAGSHDLTSVLQACGRSQSMGAQ